MAVTLRLSLALAAMLGPLGAALGADYDPPIYVEDAPEYVPVEIGSGWYLRGDVGYSASTRIGEVDYRTFDPVTATYGPASFDTRRLDESVTFGGGFGYRFNEWIRAEAAVDGFRAGFAGTTSSPIPCIDPSVDPLYLGTSCRSEDGSEASVLSIMANGYVDLGTYVGLTPYVGAGVGYSMVSWDNLSNQAYCVDGIGSCPAPGGAVYASTHPGVDGWRFTYALMAGIAYDISRNLKLDLGYKYRKVKGGDMFGFEEASTAFGATGTQGTHGDIDQHEVKVGLRYELW